MNIKEYMKENIVYMDGGMGTLLQKEGLPPGELPERWNITHPEIITRIHKAYCDSGSNIVNMNTFGANSLKFNAAELERIIAAAADNAKKARELSKAPQEKFIALDIGPIGRLLKPYGDMDFEKAVEIYAKTVREGVKHGIDMIFIETMNDSYDTKAALLAAKENSDLPVFVSNAYSEDGKLMTGASPAAMAAMLEGMGADAIGVNCSLGPKQLRGVVEQYLKYSSIPVLAKPNAGLPRSVNGVTIYDVPPDEFSADMYDFIKSGVRIAGGCCGTTPEYIRAVVERSRTLAPKEIKEKEYSMISSYSEAVMFGKSPVLIGERINPTGKKRFKEALRSNDINYILNEGITQQEKGAHVLDVNVGLPEIDEPKMLETVVCELQAIINLPLQIDTSDAAAMERALRRYNGKAMINSVNGKQHVMEEIFPLVKKYGGLVVCLTLDDDGIPETAEKRVEIAKRIIQKAAEYGIKKKDLIFDTLAMTVSADAAAAVTTLKALRMIREELNCNTSLGVSNVSFGLPRRDAVTSAFFALALENGLSAAIMNPNSAEMMKTYYSFRALKGIDQNCADYIGNIEKYMTVSQPAAASPVRDEASSDTGAPPLHNAIVKGLKEQAAALTDELLKTSEPLDIVTQQIIPALDTVGNGFEKKTLYLPQLLISAEAAQSAFERIKERMSGSQAKMAHGKFVIATVYGDIHDIGKNIVKLILENYGFDVTDLGKDVPPEIVAETAKKLNTPFVGLSALMTTTVPAMEETIKLLRIEAPQAKVIVGGAVLTKEYADSIGADYYAKDAMATVRYALDNE